MDDTITVIVPVYKIKEEYLRDCIESLIDQGRADYQILLIDDGSPDSCGTICDQYAKDHTNITVIHQENQGVSVARNNALDITKSQWVTFVDADDWVEPDYISSLYSVLHNEAIDADIIMYNYAREYKSSQSIEALETNEGFLNVEDLRIVQRATFYKFIQNGKFNPYTIIGLWDKVYRTEFLRENDIHFVSAAWKGQDRLLNADALNSTSKIFYFNKSLYHYRCWEGSRTNRYDPNIVVLTEIEINELQKQVEKHNLDSQVKEYLNCRICTRLYSCMRLYYFNNLNPDPYQEQINKVKNLIGNELFKNALSKVNMKLLSLDEKLFVFCIKKNCYSILYALVKIKSGIKNNKLSS